MSAKVRGPFEYYKQWRDDALCATPENTKKYFNEQDIWFSPEPDEPGYDKKTAEENEALAKSLCFECPVRDICLRNQLEDQRIHGTRGGLTQEETRRTLSVDEFGNEVRRGGYPDCPFCFAPTSELIPTKIPLPEGGRWSEAKAVLCGVCGFEWKARSSHNALLAYEKEQVKLAEQEKREREARERLSK